MQRHLEQPRVGFFVAAEREDARNAEFPGAALQPAVDRYAALLELYARRFPTNWFNFFAFWQQP